MADVKLFLSCVSDEFGDYRDALRKKLKRLNVEIEIQETFKARGGDTLALLEEYIEGCDVVVHFVGDMLGSPPPATSVDDLLNRRPDLAERLTKKGLTREELGRLTYTQWEAWLAIGFNEVGKRKNLVIVRPSAGLAPSPTFAPTDASRAAQAEHLSRLFAIDLHPGPPFTGDADLAAYVFATPVLDALVRAAGASPKTKPRNLPFASLGGLFAGRDEDLADLHTALLDAKGAPVALYGLGGIGKTRLAIEYAWSREAVYSALLFVSASDGAALNAGLAGLTAFEVFDLPEKEARDDATKITALLRWLESNPTWLMILDNVDDSAAVAEVAKLMPRLKGGHVVVTARASNFPAGVRKLEVFTLDENAAAQFLLDRTDADRSKSKGDAALARALARELGGLALGLEQAGAHIATDRIGFARYLKLWSESRDRLLGWTDETLTGSERNLATTWATSVARLSPESQRLLERLAFLAPEPVPDSLLDVAVPGEASDYDPYEARAGLYAYSLISRVTAEHDAPGFIVHRLVQDFARRATGEERRAQALREALDWVNAAFAGEPHDVRSWLVLDPLAPHALAVGRHADAAEIAEPTARLFNQLGVLFEAKADYAEAEPLMRRALAIDEKSFGRNHPRVAIRLNNLAHLLKTRDRPVDAEPLYRRALAIDEKSSGPNHPDLAIRLNNLATLLQATNRLAEAEPLMRRALTIDEKSFGRNHPRVAIRLNNLAILLQETNRLAEAEPLMRRALAIDETSYGPNHPYLARHLNNLAQLLQGTNRLAEAEPLMRRALAIDEKDYGPDHPNVAIRLNNLARLLYSTNRLAEAEPLMRRALAISETRYGPDHHNVAIRLNNLAQLLQVTDRLAEAEPLMHRALAIRQESLGPDHPDVAHSLNNLAGLLQAASRLAEAVPLMRRALAIFETSLGRDHPNTVTVRNDLARVEAALGKGGG
jgi:tetratricopeptide (TPR) repeat protein